MNDTLSFIKSIEFVTASKVDVSFLSRINEHGASLELNSKCIAIDCFSVRQFCLTIRSCLVSGLSLFCEFFVELFVIFLPLILGLSGSDSSFAKLFSWRQVVFGFNNILNASEINEDTIFVCVCAHAVKFSGWIDQAIILTFITLSNFQKDNGSLFYESVDDECGPDDNQD